MQAHGKLTLVAGGGRISPTETRTDGDPRVVVGEFQWFYYFSGPI